MRMGNHNIFIAECKYWSGTKGLADTIDQLFGYVTWRDTKTAIIKFVDRKNFTAIVEEATKTMGAHPLLVRQPKKEGDTRFRYTLKHPDDPKRLITMTMLLFHTPSRRPHPDTRRRLLARSLPAVGWRGLPLDRPDATRPRRGLAGPCRRHTR